MSVALTRADTSANNSPERSYPMEWTRNIGNYCNVVGFRPTPGRVPTYPAANAWDTQPVLGPIARTVEDAAFLFSAMAGPDRRAPVSIAEPGSTFSKPLKRSFRKVRIAWTRNFRDLPVEPEVTAVLEPQRRVLESLGCIVEEDCPDFSGATEAFETLRAVGFSMRYAPLLETHRAQLKDTVIWNIEQGLALDGAKIARAERLRTEVYQRLRAFLEKYEFLLGPVNQLPPFPVETEYPTEIAGVKLSNYLDWMKSCYYITLASHPAISVPAGFTPGGLPVGLQIVGRYRDVFGVLQLAHAFERETAVWKRRPTLSSASAP
jgi:amidase